MSEDIFFPINTFFTLLRMGALFFTIIVFVAIFVNSVVVLDTHEMERAAAEISDNIVNSLPKGVFEKQKLDAYNNLAIEPVSRQCQYGYLIEIRTLESNSKQWKFGFNPAHVIKSTSLVFPAAVFTDRLIPAKLTITLFDSWLSRASCLAQRAYYSKETKTMRVTEGFEFSIRNYNGNNPDYICVYKDSKDEYCRYMPGIKISEFTAIKLKKEAKLSAVPIKQGQSVGTITYCNEIDSSKIASPSDNVGQIAICFDVSWDKNNLGKMINNLLVPIDDSTCNFNSYNDPIHKAVDFPAPCGTPVKAACSGKIVYSPVGPSKVMWAFIECSDGYGYTAVYMLDTSDILIFPTSVARGDVIGKVPDYEGDCNHLHFVLTKSTIGNGINPCIK